MVIDFDYHHETQCVLFDALLPWRVSILARLFVTVETDNVRKACKYPVTYLPAESRASTQDEERHRGVMPQLPFKKRLGKSLRDSRMGQMGSCPYRLDQVVCAWNVTFPLASSIEAHISVWKMHRRVALYASF